MRTKKIMNKDIKELLSNLHIKYKDISLYTQALTHPSYENEHKLSNGNYQRLEFVGDAVLEYIITNYIYLNYASMREGQMSLLRSSLVRMETLFEISKTFNLGEYILLGKGEEAAGRTSASLVSDVFEALTAAIYLDLGYSKVEKFVLKHFKDYIDRVGVEEIINNLKDPKTKLQEYLAADNKRTVEYKLISQTGPAHKPEFEVGVYNDGLLLGKGKGSNKLMAETNAASDALNKMTKK